MRNAKAQHPVRAAMDDVLDGHALRAPAGGLGPVDDRLDTGDGSLSSVGSG
ncbi:MAG: hypothetical protein K9L70_06555 [Thiohalocapsa sp.]|nr:hypothetical protein [Thiohalocapsa sp.]